MLYTSSWTWRISGVGISLIAVKKITFLPIELRTDNMNFKIVFIQKLIFLGEPSFELLGLGSWWPSGRLQLIMEWLHVSVGK